MDRNELMLVCPSEEMEEEILRYKEEHFACGETQVHGSGGLAYYENYDEWLNRIRSNWKAAVISLMESGRLNAGKDTGNSSCCSALNMPGSCR